jgi:hypothetical protein
LLRRGEAPASAAGAPLAIKVSAHGYQSRRLADLAPPGREWIAESSVAGRHHLHVHLVRESGGQFDQARRLLNRQLFAVVLSDLRFSDLESGRRAGQFFVDEVERLSPETRGILYSAYPKPEAFPEERFIRKSHQSAWGASVVEAVAKGVEDHLREPSIGSFTAAIADQGLVYQSEGFGSALAHLFAMARLVGASATPSIASGRGRRPLPCLLVDGESGTGKRGLAAVFHAASERRALPLVVGSCSELTNETLLRSILFGHKRGAFTDAREDRAGLVATAGKGVLLLDDFHRLPGSCSAILHSFLEDGEYARLGEEESRRRAEAAVMLTVETKPWRERRRSGELPLAFFARVERLTLEIPPLRERPADIEAQARWLAATIGAELGQECELADDAIEGLVRSPFEESNSRELRNVIERAILRHRRETDVLGWSHLEPLVAEARHDLAESTAQPKNGPSDFAAKVQPSASQPPPRPAPNEWQARLRRLAAKTAARGLQLDPDDSARLVDDLFDRVMPELWDAAENARVASRPEEPPIPLPIWEDLWRCFAVSWLGGPSPSEKVLGIAANTLRQWINDRESR